MAPWTVARQASLESSRQEYWSGCHSLLQGIFPTQGSNPGIPCCRQILYHLSHQGNPHILCKIFIMYILWIFFFSWIISKWYWTLRSSVQGQRPLTGLGWWRHLEAWWLNASYRVDFIAVDFKHHHCNWKIYEDSCEKESYLSKKVFFSIYLHALHWK